MDKGLYIGELARMTGLNTNTIRYYESQGLLLPAERSESGYRVYSEEDIGRLRFIQKAKLIGLSLAEIKDIIEHRVDGTSPCEQVATFLANKIADVEQRIKDLQDFLGDLLTLQERMQPGEGHPEGAICGYIEGLDLKEIGERNGTQG